ncbi:DDE-type integrase/transposase/recombinase [Priestia megaterium]|nr:DDE-type integrase/transposase/recombinase [Priestia megaterium]
MKVTRQSLYFCRAVDSKGNTIGFYLSDSNDKKAAKRLKSFGCFLHL